MKKLIGIIICMLGIGTAGKTQQYSRAEFIRDFTKERYILWPEDSKKKDAFTVVIVNDSALYNELQALIPKKTVFKRKTLKVMYASTFPSADQIKNGLIYINKKDGLSMETAINTFKGRPVLIVGEDYPFNQSMINFISIDGNTSFEYNKTLLEEQMLTATEELIKLSAKNEVQWNKMLAQTEQIIEQKNDELKSSNKSLRYAYRELTEKERKILNLDETLDSTSDALLLKHKLVEAREKEIAAEKDKLKAQEEKTQAQGKALLLSWLIIGVSLLAVFLFYRSFSISKKANIKLTDLNKSIKQHKNDIFEQKLMVEAKSKEITDSINYALRIQHSMFPPIHKLNKHVPESFVIFQPKDIVSGDFYWFETVSEKQLLFSVVDCTGHGVPGALMSVVGINQLNKIIKENNTSSPDKVLSLLDESVTQTLRQHHKDSANDGMDMAMCLLDKNTNNLMFSGANNPLWLVTAHREKNPVLTAYASNKKDKRDYKVTNGDKTYELIEIPADKKSIASPYKVSNDYTLHQVTLQKDDVLYVFSDGYADQFGGTDGKKFKQSRFKDLLLSIHHLPMDEQKKKITEQFHEWKGSLEQIDDVCIIGVRI